MAQYVVQALIPYEGASDVYSGNREQVKEWIKNPNRGYPLDDLEIYNTEAPDVYELFNEE